MVWIARPLETELSRLIGDHGPRLVTVFGLGGSGASSVVMRASAKALRIDLSDVTRASSAWTRLRDVRARLVWLDQVHRAHLIRPAVERWLARGEGRVVIAAREPLDLPEEHRLMVPPLDHEEALALVAGELARLGVRKPEDLSSLVALLDGWPLALRAAATELRLHGASRATFERLHETSLEVRAVLTRSWRDLGAREKAMLSALSLTRSAVATHDVVTLTPGGSAALSRLVDRALVHVVDGGARVPRMIAAHARACTASGAVPSLSNEARRTRTRLVLSAGERAKATHRRDPAQAIVTLERLRSDLEDLAREGDARTSVQATLVLEPLLAGRLEREEVLTLWQRAAHLAKKLGPRERADVALALARTLIHRGDHESAERVLRDSPALGSRPLTSIHRTLFLSHIAAWRGATTEATALLDASTRDLSRATQLSREEASALAEDILTQRAFVAYQREDWDATERLARECATLAGAGPATRLGAIARRLSAEVLLRRGDPAAAVPLFTATRDELMRFGDHAGGLFVWSRLVEALRAAGDARAADEARAAHAIAASAEEGQLELSVIDGLDRADVSPPRVSELAWRSQIPSIRARALEWLAKESEPRPVVALRLDPKTFRAWLSERAVSLGRRRTLWRVVRALAEGHARATTLSNAALFSAGWPGERAEPASQKQRVHTAIWTLRRLLFGPLLETRPEGYALHSSIHVARTDTSPDLA